ncbi:MAG: hypothetical protein OER96_12090 [Gammaproteobacteria bacterium]|nr:hypothetical protein [Gammaproteobacteria bacterium]
MATDLGSVYSESLDWKNVAPGVDIVDIGTREGKPAQFVRLAAHKQLSDLTGEEKLQVRILEGEAIQSGDTLSVNWQGDAIIDDETGFTTKTECVLLAIYND